MCINLYESMKFKRDDRAIEPLKRLFATKIHFGISRDKRDFLSPLLTVSDRYVLSTFWIAVAGYLDVA